MPKREDRERACDYDKLTEVENQEVHSASQNIILNLTAELVVVERLDQKKKVVSYVIKTSKIMKNI